VSDDVAVTLSDVALEYVANGRVTRAVEGVSLEVPRGATVAFVGASGCGKSTLLKLISGLLAATSGTIAVDGRRVSRPLKNVGMAFQNPVLLPWRTVLGNLLLPFEILRENHDPRVPDRSMWTEKAHALLGTVGLAGAEQRQPRELSGGMRQRVSLCRALIHEPALLLLDEPFAALDAFTREEMWELHQELRLHREFTGVLVTHDLREAVFLAQTIYVMSSNPGRIAHVHEVDFPVPRTLAQTYGAEATELIQLMREEIRPSRGAVA
jgi:NitT/TauT family transport system ATP-binding protein